MDLVGCRPRGTFREYQTCSRGRLLRFLLGVAAVVMGAVALLALLLAGLNVRILLHGEDHGSNAKGGAVRTKCAWYLDCNAVTETIHVAKGCAPSNDHVARMCAGGLLFRIYNRGASTCIYKTKAWLISSDHDGRQHGHICR